MMSIEPGKEAYIGPFCSDELKKEFQNAVDKLDLIKIRELCLQHNPAEVFARFSSRSKDLDRKSTKAMSVVRLAEERAYWSKIDRAQDLAAFVRVMALKFLPFAVAAGLLAS